MHVRLLAVTPDPERLCSIAALGCYSAKPASELHEQVSEKTRRRVLRDIVASGHHSVIEHAVFTFSLEGISRACSHQLVRHRVASYSQQSQRYVAFDAIEPVTPPSIAADPAVKQVFDEAVDGAFAAYRRLLEAGIPAEDARFVLPNAAPTNLIVTMNARELNHLFSLRTCARSQWEIREVTLRMLELAREQTPDLFVRAGPACVRGPCSEGKRTCGRPWRDGRPPEPVG